MMRITREEENYIGRARAGIHLRAKIGFRKDGRISAMDLCAIGDCGPYSNQGDVGTIGSNATALYNPESIRFRGVARAHQHASARVAARAGRRAGRGDARADDQQGRASSRRRPGRDSENQRAGHRHRIRATSAAGSGGAAARRGRIGWTRGCAGRDRRPSRNRRRWSRAAQPEEGRRPRGKCPASSRLPPPRRPPRRAGRSSRAVTCAKRSTSARSCSNGTSARRATASASERKSRASASASAPIRPARLRWTDCCSSAIDGKVYVHSRHRQSRHRFGA